MKKGGGVRVCEIMGRERGQAFGNFLTWHFYADVFVGFFFIKKNIYIYMT